MAQVVVVKFRRGCKTYYFDGGDLSLAKGQGVIVETARGAEYAVVVDPAREVEEEALVQPLKRVIRAAGREEQERAEQDDRRAEAMKICKEKIAAHGLPMKLIDCEFTFDGSKVVFTFTAESRVDFRELVRDLASVFHMRIELRQVGIRDEARILGGIAPCGREVCCASCMPEFRKVSIKMAKNQGLSLNPGKISGLCGRLMCCLAYEDEYYASVCKQMPKIGGTVSTPEGRGTVVSANMLKQEVRVKIEKDGALIYRDFPAAEVHRGEGEQRASAQESEGETTPAPERPAQEEKRRERRERPERAEGGRRPERTEGGKRGGNDFHGQGGRRGGKWGDRRRPARPEGGDPEKKS